MSTPLVTTERALAAVRNAREYRDSCESELAEAHAALKDRMADAKTAGALVGSIATAAGISRQRVRYHLGG